MGSGDTAINAMGLDIDEFRRVIYGYYTEHGRVLPWRLTWDPYCILVSELMLQQTQVQRVLGKYEAFVEQFPDFASLAQAPLDAVLRMWQGLGYNRRAMALKHIALRVTAEFGGVLPCSTDVLRTLPGIGAATASAVLAFAFNVPVILVETNIRTVFIHLFFSPGEQVRDTQLVPLIEQSLDRDNPREWYYALMDYGTMLKKNGEAGHRRSMHYRKQSRFEGSDRQVRGRILKLLLTDGIVIESMLIARLGLPPERVTQILSELQKEGFVRVSGEGIVIAEQ